MLDPGRRTPDEDTGTITNHSRHPYLPDDHAQRPRATIRTSSPRQRPRRLVPRRLGGEAPCQRATAFRTTRQLFGRFVGQAAPRRTALLE